MGRFPRFFFPTALFLAGCAVGPDFHPPESPEVSQYTAVPLPEKTASTATLMGESQSFLEDRDLPHEWWQLFHSEELDQVIRLALEQSPTLASAEAKLSQAIQNARAQRDLLLFPQVDLKGGATQYSLSSSSIHASSPSPPPNAAVPTPSAGIGGILSNPPRLFSLYNAAVNVSYNLDLFGLEKRKTESLYAEADYQQYALYAAQLTLVANIATTAFSEASLRAQIDATEGMVAAYERQLEVMERQVALGGIAPLDALAQTREVEKTKASLPSLVKGLEQARNQLAVYSGLLPSDARLPPFCLESFQLPTELPLSIPSELVRRRPDILAAEAQLHKANADVGAATANLFPQLSLTGGYGPFALRAQDLLRIDVLLGSIGASLSQPLFHGGELLARRRAALAALEYALAQYRQTILQGFQNVGDALQALESDARTLHFYAAAAEAARTVWETTQNQFNAGGASYLALLDAEYEYHKIQLNLVQAQAARLADTAALFQALGGGWNGDCLGLCPNN